ncbi:MAG: hypothetical protein IT427_18465 [Pirellulales bacterium]|nr:hypothetical protein [Pirellulales bacterium]
MSNASDIDDYDWLIGSEATKWLAEAAIESQRSGFLPVRLAARLRANLSPARARLVLEQVGLRMRGREKFDRADSMFFTPLGLEQATDELVATYKAGKFPPASATADFCCGIGGDAIALAQRGPVVAVDRDSIPVILTKANLRANSVELGAVSATVLALGVAGDHIGDLDLPNFAAWHIDPDRRPAGRRTTKVELHTPSADTLHRMVAVNPNAAIKLAPAAELTDSWWREAELEWISRGRQCRQLVVWCGSLAGNPGDCRATVIGGHLGKPPRIIASFVGERHVECSTAEKIGAYVFEPDSAVLAAQLEGALAQKHDLRAIASGVAYFTSDRAIADGAMTCFQVLATMPYHVKRLRTWLAERKIGRLEIKKRGVPLEPEQVRRELRPDGADAATILLTRLRGQFTAIVARRISAAE